MISLLNVSVAALAAVATYAVLHTIYNLFFHPLRSFPGPFLFRASRLPFLYATLRGTLATDVLALYERYGPVVRLAPNELAFSSAQAWKDIYGHRPGGEELSKSAIFYRTPGVPPSIIAEDKENHAVLRRLLAGGFSDRSMKKQEGIIGGYVDLLVRRLRGHATDRDARDEKTGLQGRRKLDLTSWYTWTTFDIIGKIALGEPFGCLDRAQHHPWVDAISATIRTGVLLQAAKYLGLQVLLLPVLRLALKGRKEHSKRTQEKLVRRMEVTVERHDLIEGLLTKKDVLGMDRLRINASTLIVAGSETTATLLSGVTYLLLSNPETLRRLTDEVRSTFKSDDEITLLSVGGLTYMLACLNEALRRYPPVPIGMPRQTGNGEATIDGRVVPAGVSISMHS